MKTPEEIKKKIKEYNFVINQMELTLNEPNTELTDTVRNAYQDAIYRFENYILELEWVLN